MYKGKLIDAIYDKTLSLFSYTSLQAPLISSLTFTQSFLNTHMVAVWADFIGQIACTSILISEWPLVRGLTLILLVLLAQLAFKSHIHAIYSRLVC